LSGLHHRVWFVAVRLVTGVANDVVQHI
jgi:hypothetical protein